MEARRREYIGEEPMLHGRPTSVWLAGSRETAYEPLTADVEADVAVIGGGLTGVLAAVQLAEAGRSVVLLEARRLGGNATGHTTAKATVHHGLTYAHLKSTYGELGALRYAEANMRGLDLLRELSGRVGGDYERVPSYLYVESPSERDMLRDEADVMASLGLPAEYVESLDVPFPFAGAVRLEDQGQFDPMRLLLGAIEAHPEVRVFEQTRATRIDDGEPCVVSAEGGRVTARDVVVASQFPAKDTTAFFSRLFAHTAFALAVRVSDPLGNAMFYCEKPEHAVRWSRDASGPLLVISGESRPTGARGDERVSYVNLEDWTRRHFDVTEVAYHWSTEDYSTPDKVPFTGRMPRTRHVWMATGFGGWGMTNAAASALVLRNLVLGERDSAADLLDPGRVPKAGYLKFLEENLGVAEDFTIGRVMTTQMRDPEGLGRDEGAIVSHAGKVHAAYRVGAGPVTLLKPECTHLKCQVNWNEAEKTWDCPCHGSRFAHDGGVLYGPAKMPLVREDASLEDTP